MSRATLDFVYYLAVLAVWFNPFVHCVNLTYGYFDNN